ncbi:MAG: RHS repeat-associated core domain-containing protein [Thermoanaerobaculia bacterium]
MRNRATLLLLTLLLLAGLPARAQQHPNTARGLGASGTFSSGDVDNVNLFNGNLVIRIPLGQSYPVSGSLSYQLTLVYNNNVWDYQQVDTLTQALPNRTSNAGLGWTVSLGRFNPPSSTEVDTTRNAYLSPDGSLHTFYPTLHEGETAVAGVEYTRDGSYLRYKSATSEVEFPDGSIHKFNAQGFPVQIRDRFNNQVNIDYGTANQWILTDPHGRTQRVYFRTGLPGFTQAVDRVELTAFGTATATYSFLYSNDEGTNFVVTGCRNTDPATANTAVALLTQLTLPDGSTYRMPSTDYSTQTTAPCQAGMLKGMTLPTLGRVEWDYMQYAFPTDSSSRPYRQLSTGVNKRRLKDAAGGLVGEWVYTTALTPASYIGGPIEEMINTVTDPLSNKVERYFSVAARTPTYTESYYEYGLPFSRLQPGDGAGRFLSTKVSNPAGTLMRTTYLRYEHDQVPASVFTLEERSRLNQRPASQRTVFEDDVLNAATTPPTKALADFSYSNFDGLGHYRSTATDGNFAAGNVRTVFTNYNPSNGTYDIDPATNAPGAGHNFSMVSSASPWLPGLFSDVTTTESGVSSKTEYCFDGGTGFLQRKRTLRTGTARGGADLVARFTATVDGNLQTEEYFGGDGAALDTASQLCAMPLPGNQYRIEHTYQYGTLRTSQYGTAAGGLFSFKSLDRDIDARTGLVWKSRDVSGLLTTFYEYDTMGRNTYVKPAQEGWTRTGYTRAASAASLARVNVDRLTNGGATVLAQSRTKYDALGRVWQEDHRMADGNWSTRETLYNALGWRTSVSEQGATGARTSYSNYDPFGRPGKVTPPDGTSHDVTISYLGVRSVARTAKVATAYNTSTGTATESQATTTEIYDRQGRLLQVTEPNSVVTKYEYDVGSRLKRVCQAASGASTCGQERLFTYDNRGFLTSEKHPEKGATGNGTVTYQSINSRGHAQRVIDGSSDLTYSYDRAERLVQVQQTGGSVLKVFTYGTATGNSLSDMRNGKLVQAQRYNFPALGGVAHTALVTEAYTFAGLEGRASKLDTSLTFDGTTNETFTQAFTYEPLGQVLTTDYPQCTFAACASTARTVTNAYTNGFLTGISGYTGTVPGQAAGVGITYHPNGQMKEVSHVNGVLVTQANDPNGMSRPASITASLNGVNQWTTGTYKYDGSGNVWKMGTSWFEYDLLSRVKTGTVFPDPLGTGAQQKQSYLYDNFGNLTSITTEAGAATPVIRVTSASTSSNRLTGSVAYDSAGNLTAWNGATYQYDPFNQVVRMTSGAEDWFYIYTATDERFWSYRNPTVAGEARFDRFTLRGLDGRVLREFANSGYTWTNWEDYIYRNGELLAGYLSSGQRRHFHLDHLGTPRLITNTAGTQVGYHAYFPFGEEATALSAGSDRMQFTGHERDLGNTASAADDLDYMHARHYHLLTGRFSSVDPILGNPHEPQSWNRYAYVMNHPLVATDPKGLWYVGVSPFLFFDIYGFFSDSITVTTTGYNFNTGVWGLGELVSGGDLFHGLSADSLIGGIRGYYQDRFEKQALDENYLAALIDYIGLELVIPQDGSDLGIQLGMALIPGPLDNELYVAAKEAKMFTRDQQALVALAKEAEKKGGVTLTEAKTLGEWAKELGLSFRGPEIHPERNFNIPHIHVGPVDHIPVKP